MASTDSTLISNLATDPVTLNDMGLISGKTRVAHGTVAVADGDFDADGDYIRLARIPATARITSIKLYNDDMDTGTDSVFNVGLYKTDGTVADEDCFATLLTTFQAANTAGVEARFDADITNIDDRLYTLAGDSDDSEGYYDVVLTQTATVSNDNGGGDVTFVIEYVID